MPKKQNKTQKLPPPQKQLDEIQSSIELSDTEFHHVLFTILNIINVAPSTTNYFEAFTDVMDTLSPKHSLSSVFSKLQSSQQSLHKFKTAIQSSLSSSSSSKSATIQLSESTKTHIETTVYDSFKIKHDPAQLPHPKDAATVFDSIVDELQDTLQMKPQTVAELIDCIFEIHENTPPYFFDIHTFLDCMQVLKEEDNRHHVFPKTQESQTEDAADMLNRLKLQHKGTVYFDLQTIIAFVDEHLGQDKKTVQLDTTITRDGKTLGDFLVTSLNSAKQRFRFVNEGKDSKVKVMSTVWENIVPYKANHEKAKERLKTHDGFQDVHYEDTDPAAEKFAPKNTVYEDESDTSDTESQTSDLLADQVGRTTPHSPHSPPITSPHSPPNRPVSLRKVLKNLNRRKFTVQVLDEFREYHRTQRLPACPNHPKFRKDAITTTKKSSKNKTKQSNFTKKEIDQHKARWRARQKKLAPDQKILDNYPHTRYYGFDARTYSASEQAENCRKWQEAYTEKWADFDVTKTGDVIYRVPNSSRVLEVVPQDDAKGTRKQILKEKGHNVAFGLGNST